MRVLVTGGAGYIGSHAVRALVRRGHRVLIYDDLSTGHRFLARNFDLVVADLADAPKLATALAGVDAVMHFAAKAYVGESVKDPQAYFATNVQSGLVLLNRMLETGVKKIVFSSSCAVYGTPAKIPITEEAVRVPVNPYGISKLFFENALESYDRAYGLRFASLRYFNAGGADEGGESGEFHNPETHLIPRALRVAAGLEPALEIYGDDYDTRDGTCVRDYVHVNDLAEAHVSALEFLSADRGSASINLGTATGHSNKEVVAEVEEVTGRKVPTLFGPRRPGDPPVLVADSARAQHLLNWKPTRSFTDIVSSAWRWLQIVQRYRSLGR